MHTNVRMYVHMHILYMHTRHTHRTILTVTLCSGGIACALTELCPTVNR